MAPSDRKGLMITDIYIKQIAKILGQKESLAVKSFSYFCCIFTIEILYFCAKIAFIYGSKTGIAAGIILVLGLCAFVMLSWFSVRWATLVLLVLCEIHCAFCVVMIASAVWSGSLSAPLWLFLLRFVMIPLDFLYPFILVPFFARENK
jgi:hypothetical protein